MVVSGLSGGLHSPISANDMRRNYTSLSIEGAGQAGTGSVSALPIKRYKASLCTTIPATAFPRRSLVPWQRECFECRV